MIVYVQWAKSSPDPDWFTIDLTRQNVLNRVQKKLEPTGNETLDTNPGWINAVNCQGVVFEGFDHYAFEVISASHIIITAWFDDPVDHGTTRLGCVYNFQNPAPDPNIGGRINTVQTGVIYATDDIKTEHMLPWSEFVVPPASQTWHGVWLPTETYQAHVNSRSSHGWRDWIANGSN